MWDISDEEGKFQRSVDEKGKEPKDMVWKMLQGAYQVKVFALVEDPPSKKDNAIKRKIGGLDKTVLRDATPEPDGILDRFKKLLVPIKQEKPTAENDAFLARL